MDAWVRGRRVPNFGIGRVGHMGPQNFGAGSKIAGVEILVWVKHDFMNFIIVIL